MIPMLRTAIPLLLILAAGVSPVTAQVPDSPPHFSRGDLGGEPFGALEMLYQRTIFNIDIFTLRLEVDPALAARLREKAQDRPWDAALEGEIASEIIDARDVLVGTRFHRDVDLDRFMAGLRDNLSVAREAGYLTSDEETRILAQAESQYAPLRERGIRKGDSVWHRVEGDAVEVAFQDEGGALVGRGSYHGREHRVALLASYLAQGSEFRDGLLRSLPGAR